MKLRQFLTQKTKLSIRYYLFMNPFVAVLCNMFKISDRLNPECCQQFPVRHCQCREYISPMEGWLMNHESERTGRKCSWCNNAALSEENCEKPWRMSSSWLWRLVDLVWTDVSKEHVASIFKVEKSAREEPAWAGGCNHLLSHPRRRHSSCKIWGFHGGDYDDYHLLGDDAVWLL
jgi:hypothetical protein